MSQRKGTLRQAILSDHAASLAILTRLTPEQWEMAVPSETEAPWRALDVLAHLAVSEGGQLGQIRRCVAGEVTVPDDFDLARYNRRSVQKQAGRTVAEHLAEINRAHAEVLATLDAVDEADLDKTGRHARGDILTVEAFFHRITEHRRQHAEALARDLGG